MRTGTRALLLAESISKRFGDRRVLSSASLRAVPGELRVLFGRNGCGKSTLLKIAVGRLRADTGIVRWDGVTHDRVTLAQLARVGVFWLSDRDLFSPALSLGEQLLMLAERFPHAGVDASTRVLEAFERVGLGVHVEHRPTVLSSGERRRAEIAALLVRAPRAILADEPLRNLSPIDADAVAQLFRALAETGAAVIISGHETETLFSVAHHITWCTSGTTLELGSPERARQYEQFRREYLCGVQSDIG